MCVNKCLLKELKADAARSMERFYLVNKKDNDILAVIVNFENSWSSTICLVVNIREQKIIEKYCGGIYGDRKYISPQITTYFNSEYMVNPEWEDVQETSIVEPLKTFIEEQLNLAYEEMKKMSNNISSVSNHTNIME